MASITDLICATTDIAREAARLDIQARNAAAPSDEQVLSACLKTLVAADGTSLAQADAGAVATRLARVMQSAGWDIQFIDLDLTAQAPKADIRVMRDDGRWLHARVDSLGRASIERFQRDRFLGMSANTKGRRPQSPQVEDRFLGRTPCLGARQMLRELTRYLTENALQPVALADMRSAWGAIMSAPARLEPATPARPEPRSTQ